MASANASPAPPVTKVGGDFAAAIFFDNEAENIDSVMARFPRGVVPVKVKETRSRVIRRPIVRFDAEPLASYIASLGDNSYYKFLVSIGKQDEAYDAASGIDDSDMAVGREWLRSTAELKPRAALLDWDRTITKVEGVYDLKMPSIVPYIVKFLTNPESPTSNEKFVEDILLYLCGGNERLASLRAFVREMHEAGVDIYIITNNEICGGDFFTGLMSAFFQDIPHTIICSSLYPDKGYALAATYRFRTLSKPKRGGRRSRTLRRRNIHRGKTRKMGAK